VRGVAGLASGFEGEGAMGATFTLAICLDLNDMMDPDASFDKIAASLASGRELVTDLFRREDVSIGK